ncbi:MAG: 1,4-alpha-glucan branching protein GlgB [Nitrospirae bacterium]|nr:1,4-alpha-glucan branching protein GlgB [Candidatus Manganitrophaceae bacterium]
MKGAAPQISLLTDHDIYLLKEGSHFQLHHKMGAHPIAENGLRGVYFAVWAPNAESVSVVGDFNDWNRSAHPLIVRPDGSGVWEGFFSDVGVGAIYKYHIASGHHQYEVDKGDPFAFWWELPPRTASVVWDLGYEWGDQGWMSQRAKANHLRAPISIYEMHLGSWRRVPEEGNRPLTYRELAKPLTEYLQETGFTHVEFLPLTEHPFYGSWGYQTTGYFAPSHRYGTPQDLMYLIDTLHQNGIGVILDWVPSHFPTDQHGPAYFDGTHLYEHADPRKGYHPDWNSSIFNYGRNEVQAFLISSALFWLEKYHIDGLRIDAVASMLYLDYSRKSGEWIPNMYGGRENLEAISLLKRLNEAIYGAFPDVQTYAEESTAWPMVSRPVYVGGLGFGMKWNMGWMHDTLSYFSNDPVFRKYHQNQLTFSIWYAFFENFVLPLSHDEVVHGKGSLLSKMPGDGWQKFANLRLLFGYMFTHPGKKLLFMGGEFGQGREWNHEESLEWHLLQYPQHQQVKQWLSDVNRFYRNEPALHQKDFDQSGFEWIDFGDAGASVISYLRRGDDPNDVIVMAFNFTPVPRLHYRIGVPFEGFWQERLNSDSAFYGGSNLGNGGGVNAEPIQSHGRTHSIEITIPPLGMVALKRG